MTRQVTLPEEVVLKAMGFGQRQFLRCWAKAQNADPGLVSTKVWLHLDIDTAGEKPFGQGYIAAWHHF